MDPNFRQPVVSGSPLTDLLWRSKAGGEVQDIDLGFRFRVRVQKNSDFGSHGIRTMELQMLGPDTHFGVNCDRNIIRILKLRNILPLAIIQKRRNPLMNFDGHFRDIVPVRVRHQQPHDIDRHAFGGFDLSRSRATRTIFIDRSA